METSTGIDRVVVLPGAMRQNRIACRTGAAILFEPHLFD
jgi:hypothetical protein